MLPGCATLLDVLVGYGLARQMEDSISLPDSQTNTAWDSGWQFEEETDRDWRFEFREDVGGLTPFSFGRPWTGETVKNLRRPPGLSSSLGWRPSAGNTVFAVLMTIRTKQL